MAGRLDSLMLLWQFGIIMHPIVSGHLPDIAKLCRQYGVNRLDAFGSVATGNFDPARSDIDLIAEFSSTRESGYADRYLDFADALERLFGRKVDLLTPGSIRNPVFAESIRKQAVPLYESKKHQAA
jgi:predicted nucleotidyltransferase